MKTVIQCPECNVKLRVEEKAGVRTVACPKCKCRITVGEPDLEAAPVRPVASPVEPNFGQLDLPKNEQELFGQSLPDAVPPQAPASNAAFPGGRPEPVSSSDVPTGFTISYRLREVIKGVCLLFIVVSFGGGLLAWLAVDRPDGTTWLLRWLSVGVGLVSLAGFLFVHLLKGKAPDYLGTFFGDYFDCQGFGFTIDTQKRGDTCYFRVIHQNRHSNPCRARVILRPTRKLFRKQDDTAITLEIECSGGSFGVTSVPIPIESESAGQDQMFDVIAGVKYPEGRGATLHYGEGSAFLRSKASFDSSFESALTTVALLGGSILTFKPASTVLRLPYGVSSEISAPSIPRTETLWSYGQPVLHEDDVISRFGLDPI